MAGKKFFWLTQRATPYAFGAFTLSTMLQVMAGVRFHSQADVDRYVKLAGAFGDYIASLQRFLEGQHARHIVLPVAEIDATRAVIAGYAVPAEKSPLLVAEGRLSALPRADRAAAVKAISSAVTQRVTPAWRSLLAYVSGPYRQGAPTQVGLWQYPQGAEYYRFLVKSYTTLDTTPPALHALGLQEAKRLNATLDGIRREVHFSGTLAQFKTYLKTGNRFFVRKPEQYGALLEEFVHRSAAAAPRFFAKMPKAPYGVEPLPRELAGAQTFGYYDQPNATRAKGVYRYNAWHPDQVSTINAGALICHELIPGHHFQIALQQENAHLPPVRHLDFSETGFVEGWGEYAAQLCWNMGVYRTPYERAGRVMQDLMTTSRLVVDTGMNALGWSRERAMAFMRANTYITEPQIRTETLRYSTDIPGQALAYKTGELLMLQLRAQAQRQLGSRFDMRRFHGWIIDSGAMTLDTLRRHVAYEVARLRTQ
jgi:uncharacterized protein (DUF885 family)